VSWLWIILATAVLNALVAEALDWFPRIARRITRQAARCLPVGSRRRYQQEWLAELDALPGNGLSELCFALRLVWVAPQMRRALTTRREMRSLRRAVDASISGGMLLVVWPIFMLIALVVRIGSDGPILRRQVRVGQGGRRFHLLTFRTDLRRTTALGQVIEACDLDQLPRMLNVLRGEMAFVGPPPAYPHQAGLAQGMPKPGLVSWEAVARLGRLTAEEAERRDRVLRERWTLGQQLHLLASTVAACFARPASEKGR